MTSDEQSLPQSNNQALLRTLQERVLQLEADNRLLRDDLAKRIQVEKSLLETQQKFHQLADNISDAFWIRSVDMQQVLYVSPAFERIWGRSVESLYANPHAWADFIFNEDRARVQAAFSRLVAHDPSLDIEYRIVRPDGEIRWVRVRGFQVRDGGDKALIRHAGVVTDITNRKQGEEAIERALKRLNEAQRLGKIGDWEWDIATQAITWSPQVFAIVGRDPRLGPPANFDENAAYYEAAGAALMKDKVARAIASGEPQEFELVVRSRGGQRVHIHAMAVPRKDESGRIVGLYGTIQDVSARKRSEAALRKSELRYHSLFDNMLEGYAYCHTIFAGDQLQDFIYLEVNGAFEKLTGLKNVVGKKVTEVIPGIRENNGGLFEVYARVVLTGTAEKCEIHLAVLNIWLAITVYSADRDHFVAVFENITARKLAEQALEANLREFRTLAEAVPQVVWVARPDGANVYANQHWMDYTGLARTEGLGNAWIQRVYEEDRPQAWAAWQRALAQKAIYSAECRVRRADGAFRWWLIRSQPLLDASGEVLKWFSTCTDIDDLKRAETKRRELLARLTLQIARLPLAYLLSGPDFCFTHWNPAAEAMFGFTAAEVIGKNPLDLIVPPQSRVLVNGIFARLAAGDMNAHGVSENLTKDGRTIICEWHNTPVYGPDGVFQGILSLAQDITLRQRSEEALHLRDRAIQAVSQGILITDPRLANNPIIYASPGFERLSGYSSAEVVGRNCRFMQGKETDPESIAQMRNALRERRGCTVELLNYRKDGTTFWNNLAISAVTDASGEVSHFVGVQTDVTERRRLEEQFRQSQKMEAVGQLASGVAHDFNNVLTVIFGYAYLLLDALPADDPSCDSLKQIIKAGERSAALAQQLLAFSRKQVLAPKILDLNDVVRGAEKMIRHVMGEDVQLALVLHGSLGQVKADSGQIEQVLLNLAVNARDAMPGGGRITIETQNVQLDERRAPIQEGVAPGACVMLAVTDSGVGMSREIQRRIFEPFFTTKEVGKGTGLGLAVVHGIVKQSGGNIDVYSEPGLGSCFKIYLPRVGAPVVPDTPEPPAAAPAMGTQTILLVEDEESLRIVARRAIESRGYRVLEARNGEAALALAAQHPEMIHLLITDVVMPGMGGRLLAERLQAIRPVLKVLFMSGYADDAVFRNGILQEKVNFLRKPFSPTALAQKVWSVLHPA